MTINDIRIRNWMCPDECIIGNVFIGANYRAEPSGTVFSIKRGNHSSLALSLPFFGHFETEKLRDAVDFTGIEREYYSVIDFQGGRMDFNMPVTPTRSRRFF